MRCARRCRYTREFEEELLLVKESLVSTSAFGTQTPSSSCVPSPQSDPLFLRFVSPQAVINTQKTSRFSRTVDSPRNVHHSIKHVGVSGLRFYRLAISICRVCDRKSYSGHQKQVRLLRHGVGFRGDRMQDRNSIISPWNFIALYDCFQGGTRRSREPGIPSPWCKAQRQTVPLRPIAIQDRHGSL